KLTDRIWFYFEDSDQTYGYRRIHADLVAEGTQASPELVRQIMAEEQMIACQPRPFRITTDSDADAVESIPDLVQRDFTATGPGQKFVGDITYIPTWQGFMYLATVIDCYSRKSWAFPWLITCATVWSSRPRIMQRPQPRSNRRQFSILTREHKIPLLVSVTPWPGTGCDPRWAIPASAGTTV